MTRSLKAPGFNPTLEPVITWFKAFAFHKCNFLYRYDEGVVPKGDLSDLRAFFEALWPNSPYSFGTYSRDSVNSDMSYLKGSSDSEKRKKGEKRLVLVVNVSSPGDENAAESDGEGMVGLYRSNSVHA